MDFVRNLTDFSRLGQGPLILAVVSGVGAWVYHDQVAAANSDSKIMLSSVYALAGLGLGLWLFMAGVQA